MRVILGLVVLALAACGQAVQEAAPEETRTDAQEAVAEWRRVQAENLVLIETERGMIAIELNSEFAPKHAARMRELAKAGFYNGESFYRVIDGFVAQAGVQHDERMTDWPPLENENDRAISRYGFAELGNVDLFTEAVGHINGFPVGRSSELGREWLLHCPGAVAMARDEDPDSGGTEFYIVLDAQRYLDRNLTVFGRVIDGMEHVQALKRGERAIESGVIQPPEKGDTMKRVWLTSTFEHLAPPTYNVMNTSHPSFEDFKTSKRVREETFFYRKPPEVLDICGFETPAEQLE